MKYPNNWKAIKLRLEAFRFANHRDDPNDPRDCEWQKRNRELLKAAIDYANSLKKKKGKCRE